MGNNKYLALYCVILEGMTRDRSQWRTLINLIPTWYIAPWWCCVIYILIKWLNSHTICGISGLRRWLVIDGRLSILNGGGRGVLGRRRLLVAAHLCCVDGPVALVLLVHLGFGHGVLATERMIVQLVKLYYKNTLNIFSHGLIF